MFGYFLRCKPLLLFHYFGLFQCLVFKVHFSVAMDPDDTLAAYAQHMKGVVLSQDKDFQRWDVGQYMFVWHTAEQGYAIQEGEREGGGWMLSRAR